jgi:glycosyltransferase involved in cell wall biosynthesis
MEQGAEIEILAPVSKNQDGEKGELPVKYFAVPRLPLSLLNPAHPRDWIAIINTLASGRNAVLQSCETNRPDHILALWALPSGDWARQAMIKFSIPYSVWALGSDIWGLGRIPLIRRHLARVLREASHCFADGIKLTGDVQHISGRDCRFLPSSRVVGPPGYKHHKPVPPFRLAFLGRWHPNKGPDIFLDALELLTVADWEKIDAVRICGGGPLEPLLQQKVTKLAEVGRPIKLQGYLDLPAAQELFEWCDFVLIPSRVESIPVVFSDAMQMHRPVIATPVGDLPNLIKRFNCGVIADEISIRGMVTAIREALGFSTARYEKGLIEAAQIFQIKNTAAEFLWVVQK